MDINQFVDQYTHMNISGREFHCPYWKNVLKAGIVTVRGMFNGKGSAEEIQQALEQAVAGELQVGFTQDEFYKLAKRKRLGIDCSGFVFRYLQVLDKPMDTIFPHGINKTNVLSLTATTVSYQIDSVAMIRQGDMIRMIGGKHILVVHSFDGSTIRYVHSSEYTKTYGVHMGEIHITDIARPLERQDWKELTETGENYGIKYYRPQTGDGIFRLL